MSANFDKLKKAGIDDLKANHVCKESFEDVLSAPNIGILCKVIKKYWGDALGVYRGMFLGWFQCHYSDNREDFNRFGLYLNEDADSGRVVITDGDGYVFTGTAKVWMFGNSKATGTQRSKFIVRDNSHVRLTDSASAELFDDSTAIAESKSTVKTFANSRVECYDLANVYAGGQSSVIGYSWNKIFATGDAKVYAPILRKIQLREQAKAYIERK